MITLYHHPGACSLAPHIILEETGAPFTAVRINLLAGEHQTPAYLAINPHGRVPALTEGEFVLTEGPAILAWLGHRFPEAGLLDLADVNKVGRTHELLNFFSSSVHVAFAQIWRAGRFADSEAAREDVMENGRRAMAAYLAEIESLVPDGDWLVGGRYSIADPYLLVFYRWGTRCGLDMTAYAGWTRHKQAMLARPAVQRALATEEIEVA